mgnify:CR=1 FL=1
MAIRFRRTVRIAPGLKLNIGKKSASIRIGGKNAGYTIGTAGRTTSASIPGTGLGITSRKRHGKGGGGLMALLGIVASVAIIVAVLAMTATR